MVDEPRRWPTRQVSAETSAGTVETAAGNIRSTVDTRDVDWDGFDPAALFEAIRDHGPAPDAEQTVWAFERALEVARIDKALLEHLLVASVSLLALERDETPRTILDLVFRRSVSDAVWREDYAPLVS